MKGTGEARVLTGEPITALVGASDELDLLFCGSRGYGPLRSVIVGGVSGPLTREAACPVIVVPRGAESPWGAAARASTEAPA